ncbi:unnamed protein product [Rotaria sordida]|uniref:Uncharacterized protein n=1 Tax=Rotaria sordida TaxID=392033 RepID=A0A819L7V7_9BILA|nr:unnamed protein product [Rotaria sordida]
MSSMIEKFYSASGVVDAIIHRIKEITETKLNDGTKNIKETLSSVLQLLISMCQSNRTIKKYCQQFIQSSPSQQVFDSLTDE